MAFKNLRPHLPLLAISIVAIIFRFVYLGQIPNAVSGDELHYANTAKAVWETGKDITGTWTPWSLLLFRYPPHEEQAELPYLLHLVSMAGFPFSLFLFKLPFAILGVGSVLLLYAIAHALFGPTVGIATGFMAAINPWLVVMDRTGYEATPATFFYLLALFILLTQKSKKILWAVIPLLLGFYSYIATKVVFLPFVFSGSLLSFVKNKKQYGKELLLVCLFALVVVGVFFVRIKTNPDVTRLGDIFLPSSPIVANQVNEARKASIQSPLLSLTVNKYTVYGQIAVDKLFRILSPSYLFVEGDQFFLPVKQSFFYPIDAVFVVLGMLFLFTKKRALFFMILGFILIGTLPHLINTTQGDFSIHMTLMFPFLLILIGAGITQVLTDVPQKFSKAALMGVIILYAISISGFYTQYVSHYPLTGDSDFPMRTLSHYVNLAKSGDKPIHVYAASPSDVFTKYILYTNAITKENVPNISKQIFTNTITFDGVSFLECDKGRDLTQTNTVSLYDRGCGFKIEQPRVSITGLTDGGEAYNILGDTLCSPYTLKRYPQGIKISDFDIEKLDEKSFCETYISVR
jgi:4-amino-4-deoxy-L-arabinose transferase-like glycosyltransferase